MQLKYALIILLLMIASSVRAKDSRLQTQLDRIDSLIFHRNFEEAEKSVDRMYDSLTKGNIKSSYKEIELNLLLRKAHLYHENEKMSNALKLTLDVMEQSGTLGYHAVAYEACLMTALIYEISDELSLCKIYLDKAYKLYEKNHLESLFSHYCIRVSSYYRFVKQNDSALYFAKKGFDYAQLYHNKRDYLDACLLLGILLPRSDLDGAVKYASLAAYGFLEMNDYHPAANMYNNIAHKYLLRKDTDKARQYNDSALSIFRSNSLPENSHTLKIRYSLFDTLGQIDSAYYYFRKYHESRIHEINDQEKANIKKITEQYENDKKQAIIDNKDRQLLSIIIILAVIVTASFLLIRKNRKIAIQNKIIQRQVDELIKILDQKQVLMSELQHRVKNNLQHVISILEMQKESVNFNNVEEVIRGNQNRVHSMALLHNKLNVSENVNEINLQQYIHDLSQLVKDSYETQNKKIDLYVNCSIVQISIEKALPVGLIIVELISNSMKHAFGSQHKCSIRIELDLNTRTGEKTLFYADNGRGFDFNKSKEKGLGMEIIKGLIGQLDASFNSKYSNGFELTIRFK